MERRQLASRILLETSILVHVGNREVRAARDN
jgi:hypothetical protein